VILVKEPSKISFLHILRISCVFYVYLSNSRLLFFHWYLRTIRITLRLSIRGPPIN